MKIDGRLFIVLTVSLALIPGACAVSISGGTSVSTNGGQASGVLDVNTNGVVLQGSFTNSNVKNYNNWLNDASGKHVEETLNVVHGTGTYNVEFLQNEITVVKPKSTVPASSSISVKMQLTATNAKKIDASVSASNKEGEYAKEYVTITSPTNQAYLQNYAARATAYADVNSNSGKAKVAARGFAPYASSDGLAEYGIEAHNKEGDYASDVVRTYNGYVKNPYYVVAQANEGAAWTGLSFDSVHGTNVFVHPYSGNAEGDRAGIIISVPTGSVANYYDVSDGYKGSSDSFAHFDLTSNGNQPAEITSHAEDKALSKQEDYGVSWTYNGGSADFAVKKNPGDKVINGWINTIATSNDVDIDSSKLATKNALILDPFQKSFSLQDSLATLGGNYFDAVGGPLVNKGYAVTYYANAGASLDHIQELDHYSISIFRTHGFDGGLNLGFSKVSDVNSDKNPNKGFDYIRPGDLKFTNTNDMIILDGCDSFKQIDPNTHNPYWADTFKNAKVRGGFEKLAYPIVDTQFMSKFIKRLMAGDTPDAANEAAYKSTSWNPINKYLASKLVLIGSTDVPNLPDWEEVEPWNPPIWSEV